MLELIERVNSWLQLPHNPYFYGRLKEHRSELRIQYPCNNLRVVFISINNETVYMDYRGNQEESQYAMPNIQLYKVLDSH